MAASRWRNACLVLIALLVIPWAGCSFAIHERARGILPENLKVGWFYAEGSCGHLLGYTGAFAFGLDQATLAALKRDGLNFLRDADGSAGALSEPFFSGLWQATPLPMSHFETWPQSPGPLLRQCGERHSWLWPNGVIAALTKPGSFYQMKGRRALYVIPELGIVVGAVSDK